VATPKVERLVNLTIALLEARRPMTLGEVRRRTGYYTQSDTESARRMFERDKDALRRLGVPIVTEVDPATGELGYQAPRRAYELPDVALDADEVAALALAVRLTGTDRTHLALAKLAARAPDPSELVAQPVRVALAADPVDAVADAIVDRAAVAFRYRTAGGDTSRRTVDPYAVVRRRGAWYLVGRDHDRDALRAFRLDRTLDVPKVVGEPGAFERPPDLDPGAAVTGPEVAGVDLVVAVTPAARWVLEARGAADTGDSHGDRPVLRLPGFDPIRDRAWLLGLGADAVVLEPTELRDDVVATFTRLAAGEGAA
jgi:proteasome accessory factor B